MSTAALHFHGSPNQFRKIASRVQGFLEGEFQSFSTGDVFTAYVIPSSNGSAVNHKIL